MLYCNPAATPTRHSAQQAQQACMASCVDVLILIVLSQYIPAPICHWFVTVHFFLTVGRARRLRAKFSHIFHGGWFHWDYLWDYPAHSMWSQVWVPWISRTVAWLAIAMASWPDIPCHMTYTWPVTWAVTWPVAWPVVRQVLTGCDSAYGLWGGTQLTVPWCSTSKRGGGEWLLFGWRCAMVACFCMC